MNLQKRNSRTINSINNLMSSTAYEFVSYLLKFVNRTVFIRTLGSSYLGISGLFSNILMLLSLAEMGFGTAIMYRLYDPLKRQDEKKVIALMNFFKVVYRYVAAVILLMGICLMPVLRFFIKDFSTFEELRLNAYIVFGLYLLQTVVSYLFSAYKQVLLKADQKSYILNIINCILSPLNSIVLICVLIFSRDFMIYLFIMSVLGIAENLIRAYLIDRQYPYLKNGSGQIEASEKRTILNDCFAIFLTQISTTILKTTDNFVLSIFVGLKIVGLYSNYYMIYTLLNNIPKKVITGVQASLGNKVMGMSLKEKEQCSSDFNFMILLMYGVASCAILGMLNELLDVWLGSEYVIGGAFVIALALELYINGLKQHIGIMRHVFGLFSQYKFAPIFSAGLNVIISIILVKPLGITGVLLGTICSDVFISLVFSPLAIFKYGLSNSKLLWKYYLRNFLYLFEFAIIGWICRFLCQTYFCGLGWFSVIIHGMMCGVVATCGFVGINILTKECKNMLEIIFRLGKCVVKKQ